MKPGKRLIQYAFRFRKTIILGLVMLTIAVAAELTGPFIAKKMIDDHILGIEKSWYTASEGPDAVKYNGSWYKRSDHFREGEEKGRK